MMLTPKTAARSPVIFSQAGSAVNITEVAFVLVLGVLGAGGAFLYRTGHVGLAVAVLGVPFIAACVFQPRVGVYAYGFWQAWDSAIKLGGGTGAGWMTVGKILAVVVVMTGLLHAYACPSRISASRRPFAYLFALCTMATLSVAWSYAPVASVRFAAQMWLQLALAWVVVKLVGFDRAQMTRLMFWVVLGALTASTYVLLFGMDQRVYLRATLGESANPVSVAAALVTGLACVPLLWVLVSSRIVKLPLLPVGLIILFGIFATGTRAAVAAVGGGFILAGVLSKAKGIVPRVGILLVSVVLVLASMLAALSTGMLSEQSESRLRNMLMLQTRSFDPNAGLPQARRSEIWLMSLDSYRKTYLIGTGVGATPAANERLAGRYRDVHSSIIASLTELGPIGCFVFVALHLSLFLRIRRLRISGLQGAALIGFVGFVLMGSTHTVYTTKWFWLPVTFLLAILELDARQRGASMKKMGARHA